RPGDRVVALLHLRGGFALIFISHSSRNNDKAIAVRDWLVAQGWGMAQIYLDLDSLHSGERWRHALNDIGANCEAVIACLSDDWLRSPECIREFNHAESGGKAIIFSRPCLQSKPSNSPARTEKRRRWCRTPQPRCASPLTGCAMAAFCRSHRLGRR